MNVLVARNEVKAARRDLFLDRAERSNDAVALCLSENTDHCEHRDVRTRTSNVLTEHALIERQTVVQCLERLGRTTGESPMP